MMCIFINYFLYCYVGFVLGYIYVYFNKVGYNICILIEWVFIFSRYFGVYENLCYGIFCSLVLFFVISFFYCFYVIEWMIVGYKL